VWCGVPARLQCPSFEVGHESNRAEPLWAHSFDCNNTNLVFVRVGQSHSRLLLHSRVRAFELRKHIKRRSRYRCELGVTRFAFHLTCKSGGARMIRMRLLHNMHANAQSSRRFGSESVLVEHDIRVIVRDGSVRGVMQLWRSPEKVSSHLPHHVRADGPPRLHPRLVRAGTHGNERVPIPKWR
jgi:hypothetical protein